MVYILMSNKSEACYSHVFDYIQKNVCSLKCAIFVTDYERAMRNALKKLYPQSQQTSCWFHFCQAVKKKASMIPTFYNLIRNDSEAALLYRQFQCVPLLKSNNIIPAFEILSTQANRLNKNVFASFLNYYKRQWLEKVGSYFMSWIEI